MLDKLKIANTIEVQEELKAELLQKVAFVDEQIANLKQKLKKQSQPTNPNQLSLADKVSANGVYYDTESSWADKVWFFLNQEKRFLHSREFQGFILEKEPTLDKKLLQKRIAGALARLRRDELVANFRAGSTNLSFFWGAKEWLNEIGKIKNGYEFKKEYLDEKKSKRRIIY